MSNPDTATPATATAADDKREKTLQVIGEILRHMDFPANLDAKIGSDGGISVALELPGETAGATPGRRTHVTDALQFLANKIVNRPGTDRRWISLGIGGHPEPKQRQERKRPLPGVPAPSSAAPAAPVRKPGNGSASAAPAHRPPDDSEMTVAEDPQLSQA